MYKLFPVLFSASLFSVLMAVVPLRPSMPGAKEGLATPTSLEEPCQTDAAFNCWGTHYRLLVKNQGIPAAFADLRVRYQNNSYVTYQCHPLAHIIGQAAAEKYPDISQTYLHGDSFCWSGYYHGVLEGVAQSMGSAKLFTRLNDVCAAIPGKERYSFDYYNCVHGVGHGIMALTNNELFSSLNICDGFEGSWEQSSCASGVFMENVIVDNKNHFTEYLKPDEPLYPCTDVPEHYKKTCFLMQTSYMLKVMGGDFEKVFALCAEAPENYRDTCWQSLGRDASGRSLSNASSTKRTCDLGRSLEQKSNCIVGAVKDFISYYHSDKQAGELCGMLEADMRDICTQTAATYYQSFQ